MRWVVLVLLVSTTACRSTPMYRAPVAATPEGTFAAIEADGRKGIAPEDEALWRCELGSAALAIGDEQSAFRALHGASNIMGTLESTPRENARAIWGAESTKTWKGDPYERCMNALYKGLLYWRRGELDNASACFKRGLLADGWSEAGEAQADFAALSFLLGWVSHHRGKAEQARFSFKEAAQLQPGNPYFQDPQPERDNVLIIVETGSGPEKYADGLGGNVARFTLQRRADAAVRVTAGGVSATSAKATDLLHQATTRGKRVLDGIRRGKAVFKAGSGVAGHVLIHEGIRRDKGGAVALGAGLLVLSAITQAQADVRHWTSLPHHVQIITLSLPPGRHQLRVQALDGSGAPLPGWAKTFDVTITEDPQPPFWIRAAANRRIYAMLDKTE